MGTNNLSQVGTAPKLAVGTQVDQYFTALSGAFVPRNASGVPNDGASDFGTTDNHWRDAYFGDGTDITMFVDSQNGNVGFGTDVPAAQLQVERLIQPNIAIKTKATSGDETAQLTMGNTADINAFRLIYDNSDDSMSIYTGGRADASSNPFKINSSGELGIGGTPTYLLDAFKSSSGSTNTLAIRNTSNTASSSAQNLIEVAGSSGGNPYTQYSISGTTNWYTGALNSDSDKFIISDNGVDAARLSITTGIYGTLSYSGYISNERTITCGSTVIAGDTDPKITVVDGYTINSSTANVDAFKFTGGNLSLSDTLTTFAAMLVSDHSTSGVGSVTNEVFARFDAAAGTHYAVDSGTTKTTPGTVNAWVKLDINGTVYYVPAYTSKTA